MPIHELVRISTAADHVGDRLANLQRANDEYLQQFDPCRCAPCSNDGIPVLSGTSCNCMCSSGYQGYACEETNRRGEKKKQEQAEHVQITHSISKDIRNK